MSFEYTGSYMVPGISTALETFENIFYFDRYEQQVWSGMVIDGASRDAGNAGYTDVLRPGLLLGKLAASDKLTEWDPTASDGSEQIFGILGPAQKMQRLGANQDRWLAPIMVWGKVKPARLLIPGNSALGISGDAVEHLVRAQLTQMGFVLSDLWHGNPFGGWRNVVAKTANYVVKESDNNILFTNRGAAGAVNLTLPATAKKGLRYGAYCVADQTIKFTAGTADTMVGFNDAAADSVSFETALEKIGGFLEVIGDGTSWLTIAHAYGLGATAQTVTLAT